MWTEEQLKKRSHNSKWAFDEVIELISDSNKIPYLGYEEKFDFSSEKPSYLVLSLAPKDKESNIAVQSYSAMLEMLERKLSDKPLVNVNFYNLGVSGLRWDKCGGETSFLTISTQINKITISETLNFVLDDSKTYHSIWSSPLSKLELKMDSYRTQSYDPQ
jgi:hypothetical protein